MLKRLIQWFKRFWRGLFGSKQTHKPVKQDVEATAVPPLSDTDLEFLFTELLAGVYQAKGQAWAQNWLHKLEHRVSTQRWLEWLNKLEEKVLAASLPNNELASRLVQLGELGIGEVGDTAYKIGMKLLTRTPVEPIWEYTGPDETKPVIANENFADEEYETVTWDELLIMLQENEELRQQIIHDFGIEVDDPQAIIQALINKAQSG
ncbi:MAG: hypothetical protein EAZ87_05860 [Nostocales cyanobacterium]|nr:MAG: hypothetical protein EAZ87_05860 [Nostocales cyanobacterium]